MGGALGGAEAGRRAAWVASGKVRLVKWVARLGVGSGLVGGEAVSVSASASLGEVEACCSCSVSVCVGLYGVCGARLVEDVGLIHFEWCGVGSSVGEFGDAEEVGAFEVREDQLGGFGVGEEDGGDEGSEGLGERGEGAAMNLDLGVVVAYADCDDG